MRPIPSTPTLRAFAEGGAIGDSLSAGGGESEATLAAFRGAGINLPDLARRLQDEAAASFVASRRALLEGLDEKKESPRQRADGGAASIAAEMARRRRLSLPQSAKAPR